jgi:hypothetical protein
MTNMNLLLGRQLDRLIVGFPGPLNLKERGIRLGLNLKDRGFNVTS